MTRRFLTKCFFTALVLFCVTHGSGLSAAPLFVYNHGYVLGELNSVDFVGLQRKVISGQVSIGNNSFGEAYNIGRGSPGEYSLNNPWSFCGERKFYEQLVSQIGEFAVIEYRSPKRSSLLQCQSTNEIVAIYPVSKRHSTTRVLESQKIVVANQTYGVSAGRIVNAQKSGQHGENWSIVLQIGNSGNDFLHLQIVDADIYTFAVEALASATKIKLFHIDQIRASRGNNRIDTYIWRIETMPGL